jgi:DNA-binding beta-propeller fold protein YncE
MPALIAAMIAFAVLAAAAPAHAATTLVLSPFAHTTSPKDVAVDASGNVYIADSADNDVVKVTSSGSSSVIASGLNAPTGVAVDPTTGDLYIADTGDHEVMRLTLGGALTVVAGTGTAGAPTPGPATASNLGGPSGLAVDRAGNLYIADGAGPSGNPLVEEVAPDGTLSIFAGTGTRAQPLLGPATASPLRAPAGVAVDASGDVFIADETANVVAKVTTAGLLSIFAGRASGLAGTPTAGTATNSRLHTPTGVATDAAGDLYIADTANNRVEEVTPADRLSVLAGTGFSGAPTYGVSALSSRLSAPAAVAVSTDGVIYIANTTSGTVDRLAPALPSITAAPTPTGTATQGQTLTATTGTWANAPTSFSYGWERCNANGAACAPIAGAGAATYALTGADAGATIRSLVTATNISGSTTVASNPTAVIIPLPPAAVTAPGIAGTTTNLQTLAASPASWTNAPTKFAYKWEDCDVFGGGCSAIAGATAPTYTLALSDVGATVRVVVTASNAGGSATATSAPTAVIAPVLTPWANVPVPRPLAAPTVAGPTAVGATLTCATGRWSNGPTSYEYRWVRANAPILNATAPTYTVTAADRGQQLSCTVTAVNAGGAIQADSARIAIPAAVTAHPTAGHRKPRRTQHRRALTHRRQRSRATAARRRRATHGQRHGRTHPCPAASGTDRAGGQG